MRSLFGPTRPARARSSQSGVCAIRLALGRLTALSVALGLTGCLGGWRVGSGLTVDTNGQVGAQSIVGGSFGFGERDSGAVTVAMEGGSGMALNPIEGRIFASPGIDYVRPGDDYSWRAGVRGVFQGAAPAPAQGRLEVGAGAAVAVLRTVKDEHETGEKWGSWDSYLGLGGELRAGIMAPQADPEGGEGDRPRVRGTFALGFVIESQSFSGL